MTRRIFSRILAIVVLLSTLFSAGKTSAWYCEGRQCGVTPWRCCCDSPTGRDARCSLSQANNAGASACPSGCNCVMVSAGDNVPVLTSVPIFIAPVVATLPLPVVVYMAPVVAEPLRIGNETRGPPLSSPVLASPSLRAPPIA